MDEKITVAAEELSGAVLNKETGELVWTEKLLPDTTLTRRLAYTVSWPKDQRISGHFA